MADMNSFNFTGRLGSDPEIRRTQNGTPVCTISVAIQGYGSNGNESTVNWINCIFWKKNAEYLDKYGKKGRRLSGTGRLESRKFKDKNGINRERVEVIVETFRFEGSADGQNKANDNSAYGVGAFAPVDSDDEELPF